MNVPRAVSLIRTAAVAAVLAIASVGTAGLAGAETPLTADDVDFLNGLRAAAIGFDDPARMIDVALTVCENMYDGAKYGDLVNEAMSSVSGMRRNQAEVLITDSIWFYCPEFIAET